MRIYISGPISNNPNYQIDFANAQRELEAKGHEVINPARLSQFFPESITKDCEPGSENYKRILAVEAEIIRQMVDRVAMLKGWTHSRGARYEKQVAEEEGIPILYAEDAETPEEAEMIQIMKDGGWSNGLIEAFMEGRRKKQAVIKALEEEMKGENT